MSDYFEMLEKAKELDDSLIDRLRKEARARGLEYPRPRDEDAPNYVDLKNLGY